MQFSQREQDIIASEFKNMPEYKFNKEPIEEWWNPEQADAIAQKRYREIWDNYYIWRDNVKKMIVTDKLLVFDYLAPYLIRFCMDNRIGLTVKNLEEIFEKLQGVRNLQNQIVWFTSRDPYGAISEYFSMTVPKPSKHYQYDFHIPAVFFDIVPKKTCKVKSSFYAEFVAKINNVLRILATDGPVTI